MKKLTMLLITVWGLSLSALSQTNEKMIAAEFCGKIGESGPEGGKYTIHELQNCEWKIVPVDSSFTITAFKMSLYPKVKTAKYAEILIKSNVIPEQYRQQIISNTRIVLLEFIKAVNRKGEYIQVTPIAIRIES